MDIWGDTAGAASDVAGPGAGSVVALETFSAVTGSKGGLFASGVPINEVRAFETFPLEGDTAGIETEVLDDTGDPGIGVSAGVEDAGVVSVAEEEGSPKTSGDPSGSPLASKPLTRGTIR